MSNKNIVETTNKLHYYISLLNLSYNQAVETLLLKHGCATSEYYKEKSYNRFLNGEIKSITKGKYHRTKEGLYCHHIDEFEFENLSNTDFIKEYRYPYEYQKKDRLVYCDLIEHLILHTLIAKQTNGERGFTGYITFIRPTVEDWYVNETEPKPEWMKICKEKSYLNPNQINILLNQIDIVINKMLKKRHMKKVGYKDLNRRLNFNMTIKQYEEFKKNKQKMKKEIESKIMELKNKKCDIQVKKNLLESKQQFYREFPYFKKFNISPFQSRRDILADLYEYKYKNIFSSKKELNSCKINVLRDDLFKELHMILKEKN